MDHCQSVKMATGRMVVVTLIAAALQASSIPIQTTPCDSMNANQTFKYNSTSNRIQQVRGICVSDTDIRSCLAAQGSYCLHAVGAEPGGGLSADLQPCGNDTSFDFTLDL